MKYLSSVNPVSVAMSLTLNAVLVSSSFALVTRTEWIYSNEYHGGMLFK